MVTLKGLGVVICFEMELYAMVTTSLMMEIMSIEDTSNVYHKSCLD